MLSVRGTKQDFFQSIGTIFFSFSMLFLHVSWFLIVNDTFFLVSRPGFRKSFPEYYNSSLLELIYSKCLMLSYLKFFKMCTFLLFAADWGAWREEISEADKTEFSLFVELHSHLTEGTKKWNVSSPNFYSSGKKFWLCAKFVLAHSPTRSIVLLSNV